MRSLAAAAVVAAITAARPAAAQSPYLCLPRDILVQRLLGSYNERSVAFGVSVDGMLLEVFAGPDGSFTVVKTGRHGRACVVDVGDAWQLTTRGDEERNAGPGGLRPGL